MVKKIVLFIRDCCIVMLMHDDVECERFYGGGGGDCDAKDDDGDEVIIAICSDVGVFGYTSS